MTVSQATDEARIGSSPRMDLLRRAVCIASVAGLCSMMGSLMAGCSEPDPFDVFWLEPDGSALVVDLPPGRVDPPMPDVGPDGLDVFQVDVPPPPEPEDRTKADLSWANFSGRDLRGWNFTKANLTEADFSDANLSGATFWRANLYRANFAGAIMHEVQLVEVNMSYSSFVGADLSFGNLKHAVGAEVDYTDAILDSATMDWSESSYSNFTGASMRETSLFESDLANAVFCDAMMYGVDLTGGESYGVDFTGANLDQSTIQGMVWAEVTCPDGQAATDVGWNCCAAIDLPDTEVVETPKTCR